MSTANHTSRHLAEALGFTDADLAANRDGRLTDAQIARLRRNWRRTLWITIGIVVIGGLAATIFLFIGQRNDSAILTLLGIIITVINAATVGLGAQSYLRLSRDVNAARVSAISGVVSHTIRVSGRVATYVLKLDEQEIVVPKPVFFAVEDGKAYRLYRAPNTKTLLSGEPPRTKRSRRA